MIILILQRCSLWGLTIYQQRFITNSAIISDGIFICGRWWCIENRRRRFCKVLEILITKKSFSLYFLKYVNQFSNIDRTYLLTCFLPVLREKIIFSSLIQYSVICWSTQLRTQNLSLYKIWKLEISSPLIIFLTWLRATLVFQWLCSLYLLPPTAIIFKQTIYTTAQIRNSIPAFKYLLDFSQISVKST